MSFLHFRNIRLRLFAAIIQSVALMVAALSCAIRLQANAFTSSAFYTSYFELSDVVSWKCYVSKLPQILTALVHGGAIALLISLVLWSHKRNRNTNAHYLKPFGHRYFHVVPWGCGEA